MASRGKLKADFYRVEFHNTTWEVPKRYKELRAIGIGAFGSVWSSNSRKSCRSLQPALHLRRAAGSEWSRRVQHGPRRHRGSHQGLLNTHRPHRAVSRGLGQDPPTRPDIGATASVPTSPSFDRLSGESCPAARVPGWPWEGVPGWPWELPGWHERLPRCPPLLVSRDYPGGVAAGGGGGGAVDDDLPQISATSQVMKKSSTVLRSIRVGVALDSVYEAGQSTIPRSVSCA